MSEILAKILKLGEITGLLILGVAIAFRLFDFPYASNLFLVGLSTLAVIYFLIANTVKNTRGESKTLFADVLVIIVKKIAFIGISVLCLAYLFTILHLNGANEMLIVGLMTLVMCLIISMALVLAKHDRMIMLRGTVVRSAAMLIFYFITPHLK